MPPSPLLEGLNPEQSQAVTAPDGAIMILAGAGSGKTRVLTRRLAFLLEERQVMVEEILAVTFTNKAAREMHQRVVELVRLQPEESRSLWIGTFHGMSARILRQNADKLGYTRDFIILDASDQERLIRKILEQLEFSHVYWTPKRLVNTFSRWKDGGMGPDDVGEDQFLKPQDQQRICELYRHYQQALQKTNSMDFGDLLFNCLKLWRQYPQILDYYRFRFRHLLVDEYQDTNKVQYEWMCLLASHHGNLCVVGDDDQSIYSWRGARLDNILKFEKNFPSVQVIRLEQNYRSTGNILKAASQLIDHNAGRMGKTLWTEGAKGPPLVLYSAEDGEDEARFVAAEIVQKTHLGGYDQVAILVRAAHQTRVLEEALNHRGIPYRVVGGLRFMDRAEVKDAVAYLRLAHSYLDDMAFDRVINTPKRKLGPSALAVIQEAANALDDSLFAGARKIIADKLLGKAALEKLSAFVTVVEKASADLDQGLLPGETLDRLLHECGYMESIKTVERGEEKLENLIELRAFLNQETDVSGFLERASLEADPQEQSQTASGNRVVLSTLHAAKGLEFPIVFMVGMEEGLLPHKLAMESDSGLEEERRLAYVGMTRAQERLYLCHARRRFMYNRFEPARPSRFIGEIPGDVIEKKGLKVSARPGVGSYSRGWPGAGFPKKRF